MNSVTLVGRLTRDAELRYTVEELAIATFVIAVDRYNKKNKEADFITVKCFGKQAEFVDKWTGKGLAVAVHGRLHVGSYDKDGERRQFYEVVADDVEPIQWKKQEETFEDNFTF